MQEELRAAVEALPGVRSAVLATRLPGQVHRQTRVELERDFAGAPAVAGAQVLVSDVSPELFDMFDVTLLAGRVFGPADTLGAEPEPVVNASFVRRFYGSRSPLGTRFRNVAGDAPSGWIRIVGVTADLPMNPGAGQTDGYDTPFAQRRANRFTLAVQVRRRPACVVGGGQGHGQACRPPSGCHRLRNPRRSRCPSPERLSIDRAGVHRPGEHRGPPVGGGLIRGDGVRRRAAYARRSASGERSGRALGASSPSSSVVVSSRSVRVSCWARRRAGPCSG